MILLKVNKLMNLVLVVIKGELKELQKGIKIEKVIKKEELVVEEDD